MPEPLSPTGALLTSLPADVLWGLFVTHSFHSKNQIVLSILADFIGSLIVLGKIC